MLVAGLHDGQETVAKLITQNSWKRRCDIKVPAMSQDLSLTLVLSVTYKLGKNCVMLFIVHKSVTATFLFAFKKLHQQHFTQFLR